MNDARRMRHAPAIALALALASHATWAAVLPHQFAASDLTIVYEVENPALLLAPRPCEAPPSRRVIRLEGTGLLASYDEHQGAVCESSRRQVSLPSSVAMEALTRLLNAGFIETEATISGVREVQVTAGTATVVVSLWSHARKHRIRVTAGDFVHTVTCQNGAEAPCVPSFAEPLLELARTHLYHH